MFGKRQQWPEDWTDAYLAARMAQLKDKEAWLSKYIPRIAGGLVAAGVVLGGVGVALMSSITAPLIAMSVAVGAASIVLALAGGEKTECREEIVMLSEENKHRSEMTKIRTKKEAEKTASTVPQSMSPREAFDTTAEKMGKGLDNAMTVRRPLRLKTNVATAAP
jgi:hypothetical protein